MDKIELSVIQESVLEQIPRSSENPKRISDIATATGLSTREVHSVINTLTMKGIPVCASRSGESKGVYIPLTEQERAAGLVSLQNQVTDMTNRVKNVKQADLKWHKKLA